MSNRPATSTHILVFPFPAQGHILPLLDLTHQLALHGFSITILITTKNLPILHPLLFHHPSIQTLLLPFPSHPSIPPGVENVKDIGNHGNSLIISALSQLSDPITTWFHNHPSPPHAILSDFFLGWTHHLATQLAIPRITFYCISSFLAPLLNHLWLNMQELRSLDVVPFPHLPNSPVFPLAHLPSVFRRCTKPNPDTEIVKDGMIANNSSWGAIFNSFNDMDGVYLDHFKKELNHSRVWAVGPVSLLGHRGGSVSVSAVDVHLFLDQCPDESVIYVCFGSQVLLTRGQTEALAKGLEQTGCRFILAVKSETIIPDGFEDRVGKRGLVIKGWAPQELILSHRAVGWFLTHCGWNSVLEGTVAGVMLLAWPMEADQFVNAKLVVDDLGVAVRVCEGADMVPDSDELARVLSELMSEQGVVKTRAMELHEKALNAVKKGGSSKKDLDALLEELHALSCKTKEET